MWVGRFWGGHQRGVTKGFEPWGSRIAQLGKFGYLVEAMMCTTRKHPKLKMTNFENVQRSSMLMSTSKEGAKAGSQEKWRARQALDFLAKLGGTHFSGWSWVRGESALFVKHLSQATCSETTYIQRGALLEWVIAVDIHGTHRVH